MRIWIALATVAGILGCSDNNAEPAPREAPPPAEPKPAAAAEKPAAPAEPDPPAATIDCDTLLSPDDLAHACGGAAADWAISKTALENGHGATVCSRSAVRGGKPADSVKFGVNGAPDSPEGARKLLELGRNDSAREVQVADAALVHNRKVDVAKQTLVDVEAIKGRLLFKVGMTVRSGANGKAACSENGLIDLATTLAQQLP